MLRVTSLGHLVCHFNMLVFPALVLPLSQGMGLKLAEVLELSFWMYLLFGLTALPWGYLADRFGGKPLLALFFCGSCLSALGACVFAWQPVTLSLFLAGLGLFAGIYHPAALGLISTRAERVSIAMGINGMWGNVGLALAPLAAGLVNWFWGVKAAFGMIALVNLIGLAALLFLPFSFPEKPKETMEQTNGSGIPWPFVIMLMAMTLSGMAYRGTTLMMPAFFELKGQAWLMEFSFFKDVSGNLLATLLSSFIYLFGMAAQIAGGMAGERFETKKAYFSFHALAAPCALLSGLVWEGLSGVLVMLYVFFLLGMQPVENTLIGRYTPARLRHAAFGLKFVLVFGVGSLAVGLMGYVEASYGVQAAFPVLGLISFMVVMIVLSLLRKRKPSQNAAPEKAQKAESPEVQV